VHERDRELEVLTEALKGAVAGAGCAHLVEGPPGIGKTTVLAAVVAAAEERGLLTLRVRGSELERSHPFGGARRLLASGALVGERSFHGPGAAARAVLEDLGPARPSAQAEPGQARQLGLIAVIGSLIDEHGPIVIAADDAHLLDDPTLDLLTMLCLRLEELPLVLAIAARTDADDLRPALARLAAERTVRRLALAPLRTEGVEAVLRDRLGLAVSGDLVDASVEATGGNPWFVTALAGELARAGPAAQNPAEARALAPHAIAGAVDARVAAVPDGPPLARAIVTLGDDAELRHVAALLELPLERVLEVRDELTDAGVLRPGELRFVHSIIREAVKTGVPAGRRALDHRRAARLLADERLPPELVAAHLLDSEPAGEQWAAEQLVEAAAVARQRGAPAFAVRLLERARAESSGGAARLDLLARLGAAELEAGRAPAAIEHLSAALARHDGPPPVETLRHLAQAQASDGRVDEAIETLEGALDGGRLNDAGRAALTADLVVLGTLGPEVGARSRRRLEALGEVDAGTPEGRLVLAARARVMTTEGNDLEGTVEVAERALGEGRLAAESLVWVAWSYATYALITADRLDAAVGEIDRSLEEAVSRASVGWYCTALMLRADTLLRSGPLDRALADAETAVQAALDHELQPLPTSVAFLAGARLERGDREAAERVFAEHELDGELADHILFFPLLYERGRVRLACGRTEEGVADLLELGAREQRWGAANPGGYPWRVAALRGLRRLGRDDEAAALAAAQVEQARRWPSSRARCLAELALGLAEKNRARAEERFAAAAAFSEPATVLLRIEALIELGRTVRQQGERARARPPLRQALTAAEAQRATRLAGEAEAELRAARGRPPKRTHADDELTPSERRIAALAAAGASNREIAASLFLSVRTVETHLTSAYRRLGISSRHELSAALGDGDEAASPPAVI